MEVGAPLGVEGVVESGDYYVMAYEHVVAYDYAALVLEFTAGVDENALSKG